MKKEQSIACSLSFFVNCCKETKEESKLRGKKKVLPWLVIDIYNNRKKLRKKTKKGKKCRI